MKTVVQKNLLIGMMLFLSSCLPGSVEDSGRAGRPLITDFSVDQETQSLGDCQDGTGRNYEDVFLNTSFTECLDVCGTNQHIASEDEINSIITEKKNFEGLSSEQEENLKTLSTQVKGICVDDILRPTNAITIQTSSCACKDSSSIMLNNCAAFCSGRSTSGAEKLFGTVILGAEVELNANLGSLKGWCNNEIGDGQTNPSCVLEVTDGPSTFTVPVTEFPSRNTFTADLTTLNNDVRYRVTLVETTSNARSSSIHIFKSDNLEVENQSSIVSTHFVTQYTCLFRNPDPTFAQQLSWNEYVEKHFYFTTNNPPPVLPNQVDINTVCHNYDLDLFDNALLPRLQQVPGFFAVWNFRDNNFVDLDGNSKEDINDRIQKQLADRFGISREINVFGPLTFDNGPTIDGVIVNRNLGYFMLPFIDPITGNGFCPSRAHYEGPDPLFNLIGEHVGVSTEGLYFAVGEPEVLNNVPQRVDLMLIREGLLRRIWFYYENGQHLTPDDFTVNSRQIHFYWPASITDPHVRRPGQKLYTISAPEDLSALFNLQSTEDNNSLQTSIRPPDKRFGCIPAIDEINNVSN